MRLCRVQAQGSSCKSNPRVPNPQVSHACGQAVKPRGARAGKQPLATTWCVRCSALGSTAACLHLPFARPPPPPHTHPRRTTWIRCRIAPRRSGTLLMSRTTRPRQTGAPWQVRHQSLPCAGLATGRSGACSTCDEMHARMEACELAGRAPGRYPGTSAAFNGQAHLWRHMHAQGCVRGHHARARGRRGARPQRDRICVRRDRQRQDVLHGW